MKFFTDDYFHIGKAHLGSGKPCQDYAISGGDENFDVERIVIKKD